MPPTCKAHECAAIATFNSPMLDRGNNRIVEGISPNPQDLMPSSECKEFVFSLLFSGNVVFSPYFL